MSLDGTMAAMFFFDSFYRFSFGPSPGLPAGKQGSGRQTRLTSGWRQSWARRFWVKP